MPPRDWPDSVSLLHSCGSFSGSTITYALANAGLADFLHRHTAGQRVNSADVAKVHARMVDELRTNASGLLGRRYPARASELQLKDPMTLFPAFALDAYLHPPTSSLLDPEQGWPGFGKGEAVYQKRGKARSEGRGDLEGFAKACEKFFEWGTKDLVAKKFASESVGLFGSELVTCARELVRLKDPMSPSKVKTKELEKGDPPTGPRITSFFQSTSSSSRPRKSFTDLPSHVIKIHSSRQDPTNPELKEFRISFSCTAYIERCHAAMDGHRVDPKELDITERANLGLVDKEGGEKEDTAPAAATKSEVRLWIAEYLVQEAWPEFVTTYEEELAAKAKPKAKKVVKKSTKAKAGGENAEAFKSFFTKPPNQTQPRTQTRAQPPLRTQRAISSEEEEEETIEWRPPSSRSSSLTPPPPSSPLPSLARIKKTTRPRPPSSTSASSSRPPPSSATTRTASQSVSVAKSPPRRGPRRSARFKQAKASQDIIDLCSTDEESVAPPPSPPAPARRALAATTRTNASSPVPVAKSKTKSKPATKGKTPSSQSQSLLSMPVVRPMSTLVTTSPLKVIEEPILIEKKKNKEKEKAPLYLVTYEDDQVVELDVRGRWARGESVGPWEDVV
jgi:Holliday junction resolvase YEN1